MNTQTWEGFDRHAVLRGKTAVWEVGGSVRGPEDLLYIYLLFLFYLVITETELGI